MIINYAARSKSPKKESIRCVTIFVQLYHVIYNCSFSLIALWRGITIPPQNYQHKTKVCSRPPDVSSNFIGGTLQFSNIVFMTPNSNSNYALLSNTIRISIITLYKSCWPQIFWINKWSDFPITFENIILLSKKENFKFIFKLQLLSLRVAARKIMPQETMLYILLNLAPSFTIWHKKKKKKWLDLHTKW